MSKSDMPLDSWLLRAGTSRAPSILRFPILAPRPAFALVAVLLSVGMAFGQEQSPFSVLPAVVATNGTTELRVHFGLPPHHHLYADRVAFRWEGENSPVSAWLPEPQAMMDKFSGEERMGFEHSFEGNIPLANLPGGERAFSVSFQGCDETRCYFPETHRFALSADGQIRTLADSEVALVEASNGADWKGLAAGFHVVARGSGYMSSKDFLGFLDSAAAGSATNEPPSWLERWGWLGTLALILLGGIGLNLTPCILPLIPINLSLIGAGANSGSRQRGFALGATYGLGMAAAYGVLGVFVVLTGSKFGSLNSSPWFNLGIALVFGVLALGMFDKLAIDFSRFRGRYGGAKTVSGRGPYFLALTMGAVAALLAGACVAPVVISVLLLAAKLYSQGHWLGLVLPFCLGLGMALPWPAAGAGLSLLPKPGAWMTRVKHGFGVFIALFAVYYGHLSYSLVQPLSVVARQLEPAAQPGAAELFAALKQAREDGKPVVIDFWASWCKNCSAMEQTTFKNETVRQHLAGVHTVKYQAEHPNQPPARQILDYFGAMGLPTYVVLAPRPPAAATDKIAFQKNK